jgi:putative ATPase
VSVRSQTTPLAERMRPRTLGDFVGQRHLLDRGKFLSNALESGRLPSLILWGPPGSGKTTLARILSDEVGAEFVSLSAVTSGVKDIREQVNNADSVQGMFGRTTVLFVDEIHRFNKAQQDALLPHVERGTIVLIGATTENPSFEVNSALLSRARVLVLEPLTDDAIAAIVERAMTHEDLGLGGLSLQLTSNALNSIVGAASGDARTALNVLEVAGDAARGTDRHEITTADIEEAVQRKVIRYDKKGDNHYQTVSAFIKSMRGSDPDAALYYMVRMLEGGEDPLFVLRRMVIFASEDIGNADPNALRVALDATQAYRFMGMPEGVLPMTQAATYLASAPKSNSVIASYGRVRKDVMEHGNLPIPTQIINAPTKLMKELGHGRGYKYPHNFEGNYVVEDYLPEKLAGRRYYEPSDNGEERALKQRLESWRAAGKPTAESDD